MVLSSARIPDPSLETTSSPCQRTARTLEDRRKHEFTSGYIYYHGVRHPGEMGAVEVVEFLSHLAAR